MHQILVDILEKLREREKNPIEYGNSVIESKIGILNYPRGFGRKCILAELLSKPLLGWEKDSSFRFEILDKLYTQGQIIKKNIVESKKTNYSIIITHLSDIPLWKKILQKKNHLTLVTFTKRQQKIPSSNQSTIILTIPSMFSYLIQNYFHRKAIERILIFDPELMKLKELSNPILFYGRTWIITSDPKWILYYSDKKHFIYHFIPNKIDILLFRHLCLLPDDDIKQKLYHDFNLPTYEKLDHYCREEMFVILKGHLEDGMYSLLEKGQIKLVLEKMNNLGTCTNIFDYVQDKINQELEEATLNYQNDPDESRQLYWKEKIDILEKKKSSLFEKIEQYHNKNACIICSDTLKEPILLYCCQNIICGKCIFKWLQENNKCPYCRYILHNDDLVSLKYKLSSKKKNTVPYKKLLSKQNKITEIILENRNSYLLFFAESNDIIQTLLTFAEEHSIPFIHFQGSKREKDEYIKNILQYHFILISDKTDFIGYSFPHIHHFISYPLLEKTMEDFIFSRFYRYERTEPFYYHRFLN